MIIGPLLISAALMARQPPARTTVRRGYVQGVYLLSRHPPAERGYHRISPNLQGTTPALSFAAGGWLSRSVALEGEFFYGRTVSKPQRFSYSTSEDYIAGSRDLLINESIRYRPGGRAAEIVAGGGYARTTTSERSIMITTGFPVITFPVPDRFHSYNTFNLTGGLDGAIRVSAHVALVPGFRVRWIRRPDPLTGESLGIGSYAFQFGAGLRFR